MQEVELVNKTLMLLTQRVAYSEDKMFEVLNYIKDIDLAFVRILTLTIVETFFDPASNKHS